MEKMRRILVAVPSEGPQREIGELLRREGYEVVRAARGSEAILAVLGQEIDVALIGLHLTDQDGFETVEILRKVRPRLPLVVLSTDPSVEIGRRICQQGIYYYLLEPFTAAELTDVVGSALRKGERETRKGGSAEGASALAPETVALGRER